MVHLRLEGSRNGLGKIIESRNKASRIIEGVLKPGEEIGPHTHPYGEDCALVLSGTLTYYVRNHETIDVQAGEAVFGFQNVIHGYRNNSDVPVHLLIFATPEQTGLEYPADDAEAVLHPFREERKLTKDEHGRYLRSAYSSFVFLQVDGSYEEEGQDGTNKVFVDWQSKDVYVFDGEPVSLQTVEPRVFLRYEARS